MKRATTILLAVFLLAPGLGCKRLPEDVRKDLPLPPIGDSGVADGIYYRTDYGFGVPVPAKWFVFAGGEDWDELVRFSDPERKLNAGLYARWLYAKEKFDRAAWFAEMEKEYEKRGSQAKEAGKPFEVPAGSNRWHGRTYSVKDSLNRETQETILLLHRDDLLVWIRAFISRKDAAAPKGARTLETLKDSLSKVAWFCPIGEKGISLQHFELKRLSRDFIAACQDRNAVRVVRFFEETCPDREAFLAWFKATVAPLPKQGKDLSTLKVEPRGMVIEEKEATLAFEFTRTESGQETLRETKAFRLSKAEGNWEIVKVITSKSDSKP